MEKEESELQRQLNSWWESTLGQLVMQVEMDKLINVFPEVFGYHILMLGMVAQFRMIEYSVIPYQSVVNPFHKDDRYSKTITSRWESLPFANNSVDVIACPHTLDFSNDPMAVLHEAHRALIPEGRILLFGFNPFSLWGLNKLLRRKQAILPWGCQFQPASKIRKELLHLGFDIIDQDYFLFQPPMKDIKIMEKLGFLNQLSHLGLKGLSGIYFIEAQKKVTGVKALHLHKTTAYKKQTLKKTAAASARCPERARV